LNSPHSLAETPQAISDHVLALYSAKLLAYTKHDPEKLVIDLEKITSEAELGDANGGAKGKEGGVWIHTSRAGVTVRDGPGGSVEKK
jgi:glutamate dehydrogenase